MPSGSAGTRAARVILLDAYAVLALAQGDEAADEVEEIVRSKHAAMSAANLFEVTDRLIRRYGWTPNQTSEQLGLLLRDVVSVLPLDEGVAWRGGVLRARHYHRTNTRQFVREVSTAYRQRNPGCISLHSNL